MSQRDPAMFDERTAQYVLDAVTRNDLDGRSVESVLRRNAPLGEAFWAKTSGVYNATTGYPFTRQKPNGTGGFTADTFTGTRLYSPSGDMGIASGTAVLVAPFGQTSGGNPLFLILSVSRNLFPVIVLQTGGSAGSASAACTFEYTVKDMDGNTLKKNAAGDSATAMQPVWSRPAKGKMVAGDRGTAYYGQDGTLYLWQVDEQPDSGECA